MKTIHTLIWCKLLLMPHAFLVGSNQRSYQYWSYIMNHYVMSFITRGNTFDYVVDTQWIDFLPRNSFLLQKLLTFYFNLKLLFLSGSQNPLMFSYDPSSWLHVTAPEVDLSWPNALITWTILTCTREHVGPVCFWWLEVKDTKLWSCGWLCFSLCGES